MRRTSVISSLGALALFAHATHAAEGYVRADAQRFIMEQESAWAESTTKSDSTLTKALLAEEFVGVLDGNVYDKATAMKDAERPAEFRSNHLEYAHIRFHGNTAVVQGSEAWVRNDGQKGHYVWIDTWVWRHGTWRVVASDDTTVLDKP